MLGFDYPEGFPYSSAFFRPRQMPTVPVLKHILRQFLDIWIKILKNDEKLEVGK